MPITIKGKAPKLIGLSEEERQQELKKTMEGIQNIVNERQGTKVFTDEDRKELKEKLKAAVFRWLEPNDDFTFENQIEGRGLPDLIKILISL